MPSSSSMPVAQALQRHSGSWKQTPPPKPTDHPSTTGEQTETPQARDGDATMPR